MGEELPSKPRILLQPLRRLHRKRLQSSPTNPLLEAIRQPHNLRRHPLPATECRSMSARSRRSRISRRRSSRCWCNPRRRRSCPLYLSPRSCPSRALSLLVPCHRLSNLFNLFSQCRSRLLSQCRSRLLSQCQSLQFSQCRSLQFSQCSRLLRSPRLLLSLPSLCLSTPLSLPSRLSQCLRRLPSPLSLLLSPCLAPWLSQLLTQFSQFNLSSQCRSRLPSHFSPCRSRFHNHFNPCLALWLRQCLGPCPSPCPSRCTLLNPVPYPNLCPSPCLNPCPVLHLSPCLSPCPVPHLSPCPNHSLVPCPSPCTRRRARTRAHPRSRSTRSRARARPCASCP